MRRGFTLIELLIVITIMAILAALVFPVFARARESARATVCTSNARQICFALLLYAQDYDDTFPAGFTIYLGPPYWDDLIEPYLKSPQILVCPSNARISPSSPRSYSMAWVVHETRDLSAFQNPSGTLMVGDGNGVDWTMYYPSIWPMQAGNFDPIPRHHGTAVFGFVDGHVKRLSLGATKEPEDLWDNQQAF